MKIMKWSDLHIEVDNMTFEQKAEYKECVLLLAGDIHVKNKAIEWISHFADWFKHILYIPGNHEYWGTSFEKLDNAIENAILEYNLHNVTYLNNKSIILHDDNGLACKFMGCTLWTDYNKNDHLVKFDAPSIMKDYKKIRRLNHTRKITANELYMEHKNSLRWLKEEINKPFNGAKILMCHHAPSMQSNCHQISNTTYLYVSDLDDFILENPVNVIFHGHTHDSVNYKIGETDVISNPRGYSPYYLNPNFDLNMVYNVNVAAPVATFESKEDVWEKLLAKTI